MLFCNRGGKKWRFAEISKMANFRVSRIATSFPPLPQSRRVIPSASEESPAHLTICLQLLWHKITNHSRREDPGRAPRGELPTSSRLAGLCRSKAEGISRIRFNKNGETPIFTINKSLICYLSNSYIFKGLKTAQNRRSGGKNPRLRIKADLKPRLPF